MSESIKLTDAIDTLKNLLGRRNRFHDRQPVQPKRQASGVPQDDYHLGSPGVWGICRTAEETRLHALGLDNHPRLRRRDVFLCQAEPMTQASANQCLSGMRVSGEALQLTHLLSSRRRLPAGTKVLLFSGDHVGRKVTLAWKMEDGVSCQIAYRLPQPFTIVRHLQTCIWLDRVPEPDEKATGYLVIEFL